MINFPDSEQSFITSTVTIPFSGMAKVEKCWVNVTGVIDDIMTDFDTRAGDTMTLIEAKTMVGLIQSALLIERK